MASDELKAAYRSKRQRLFSRDSDFVDYRPRPISAVKALAVARAELAKCRPHNWVRHWHDYRTAGYHCARCSARVLIPCGELQPPHRIETTN